MILFSICLILAIISMLFISAGGIVFIILGADLIVCIAIILKIFAGKRKNK